MPKSAKQTQLGDAFDGVCRHERCTRVEIHAAHPVVSMRGRAPKKCPRCNTPIPLGQGARCIDCGWNRRNDG